VTPGVGGGQTECPENSPQTPRILFWIIIIWASLAWIGSPGRGQAEVIDAESQEEVAHLLQTVIHDYLDGGDAKPAGQTNNPGVYTNIEMAFRAASTLTPSRLDLRYGIASSLVLQALQTNGPPMKTKLKGALAVYQQIYALAPSSFEAPIWYVAYTRALGETNASQAAVRRLLIVHPERTVEYLERFDRVDDILQLTPSEKPQRAAPNNNLHAIVVLGAGLETNGTIKLKLSSRLKQALTLARLYPHSPIIVTGGNPQGGLTEAYVMSQWFMRRGIPRKRLFLEDRARDTVENALFSSAIFQRLGVKYVTVVTSFSHVRRGLADVEEACRQRGLGLQFDCLAARSKGDTDLDKEQERVGIYRDVMRISGLWSFPGMRR
jgi:vancomycin permeability regulator SanA